MIDKYSKSHQTNFIDWFYYDYKHLVFNHKVKS